METDMKNDWRPERYITGRLEENELVNTDLGPWEPGTRGVAVELPDGRRVEVFFTLPLKDERKGEFVRVEPDQGTVCAAVVELFGWVSGRSAG